MMQAKRNSVTFILLALALVSAMATAQNGASNKAFFAKDGDGVDLGAFDQDCVGAYDGEASICSAPITIFDVDDALKTSNVGAVELRVSLECALWTYNTVSTTSGNGRKSVSARAGVQIIAEIDGEPAMPSPVVFCDRLQAVGLRVDTVCECEVDEHDCSCTVTDTITLDLFEATKSAHSFNFFDGPLPNTLHDVDITAQGIVVCTQDGGVVACPTGVGNEFEGAGTGVAIGKASLVVEEHNNWGTQ